MTKYRDIEKLDLARFERPKIKGNPPIFIRALWYLTGGLLLQNSLALLPSSIKAALLRLFGAKVGRAVVIKPRVTIKSPWFLEIGDNSWIGETAWIDNHTLVKIGSNCCISQGAYIFTGNHDWNDPGFAFFSKPVTIGDGVWITAFQRIGPGSDIPPHVAVVPQKD